VKNALFALALWTAAASFAGAVTYHSLNLAGEADNGIFAEDLTGTGRFDLIGLAAGRIAIFRADPAQQAGYSPTPEVLVTGPTAYFADAADVLPDKGKEILILTPEGVWAFVQADGRFNPRPSPLIRCDTILSLNTLRSGIAAQYQPNVQVLPWNFAFDTNGDGLDDVLVPHDKGTDVYLQKPSGQFARPMTLSLFPIIHHFAAPGHKADEFHQTTSRSTRLQMVVPSLESRDVNGDGKPDLVSGPYWFAQKLDGTFDTTAAQLPPDRQSQLAPNIRIADINNDKKPDRFTEENVMDDPLNIVTRVRVFLADRAGKLPENPTQVIVDQNVLIHTNLPLHDFDGDGCLDFAMYKTDITVTEIAKWVRQAFGQIEGNLNFFLFNRAANCYGTRPDRRVAPSSSKPITMRFKVDLMEAMMGLVWERYLSTMMRFEGDYNGDGRPDLLVREKTEQISIYFNTGRRDPLFSRDPDIVLDNLPNFGGLALSDLNADGCTDLLLYSGNYDQVIAVYISRKK